MMMMMHRRFCTCMLLVIIIPLLVVLVPLVSFFLVVQHYSPPSAQQIKLIFQKPYLFVGNSFTFHGADLTSLKESFEEKKRARMEIEDEEDKTMMTTGSNSKTKKKKKILAVVEFFQETNSFSPVLTRKQNFEADILLDEPELIMEYCQTKEKLGHIGGFIEGVKDYDIYQEYDIVPILQARSVSGGPLDRQVFDDFVSMIVKGIQDLHNKSTNDGNQLSGIYLSLHGAMGVQGIRDPEGHILERIRTVVGPDLPIGASHDLHANLTKKRMDLLSFLVGYRTNPHRDFYQSGYESAKLLVQTCQGLIRPTMAYQKLRQLSGGGSTVDFLDPMRHIFNWMYDQEQQPNSKLLRLSTFMVHPWLDDEELGWSTVAVTDNDPDLATAKSTELADMNWSVASRKRDNPNHVYEDPKEAIDVALKHQSWWKRNFGCIVFCDVSDAVGAGAPGESTWILRALIDYDNENQIINHDDTQKRTLISYVTVRDVEAVRYVLDESNSFSIGDKIKLNVGGKVDTDTNQPVTFEGELIHKSTTLKVAILKRNGIHLILQEIADPLHSPYYYTDKLGLSLWDADIVVVKNLFPFRYMFWKYNRLTINIITPGVTNVNIHTIPYKNIPRPIHPLDDDVDSWQPPSPRDNDAVTGDGNAASNDHTATTAEKSQEGDRTSETAKEL